ncbi:MAG TPA: hypothetical protein DDZ89_14605, partial [Clostridiales bacterium]|nr:hypothetical protein [Clostridiales bacterium]
MKNVIKLTYPHWLANNKDQLSKDLITYHDLKSPATEAFRSLRTNLGFVNIDNNLKMVVVTSPSPKEGKTSVATNIAITVAKANKRVLVIDCDLRKPKIHKTFGLNNDIGLTHILTDMILDGQNMSDMVKCIPNIDNLWVITSGFI